MKNFLEKNSVALLLIIVNGGMLLVHPSWWFAAGLICGAISLSLGTLNMEDK